MLRCVLLALVLLGNVLAEGAPVHAKIQITSPDSFLLMEDQVFRGGFSLTAEQVQQFLNAKGTHCQGDNCLKNYRDLDSGLTAAEIIVNVAHALGINPIVILLTLQKENSLLTHPNPEPWRYRTAMGYGCPDNADCEADFFGFSNQIQLGATLLRVGYDRACGDKTSFIHWRVNPRWYRGHVTPIDGRNTLLSSCATAALYNYTPHRLDSAWIKDTSGELYYGNYNFVHYYRNWFES